MAIRKRMGKRRKDKWGWEEIQKWARLGGSKRRALRERSRLSGCLKNSEGIWPRGVAKILEENNYKGLFTAIRWVREIKEGGRQRFGFPAKLREIFDKIRKGIKEVN